jgi:putative colanic acid biosysnthesis UDP-glucose lipid carrier transferase
MENILFKQEVRQDYSAHKKLTKSYRFGDTYRENELKNGTKRLTDLILSFLTIVFVMSWLYPIVAIAIKLSSKGPVIFKQRRHGLYNKPFYCYKFRTMVMNNEADTKQATQNDQRVTKVGRFLRKTSLDEIPQVFNVLTGEMSIVGPRPHAIPMNWEFSKSIDDFMMRHAVKPGITGLAQSKGYRGEIRCFFDIYSRYKFDIFYVKNWCLMLDIRIIIATVINLLKGQKAY